MPGCFGSVGILRYRNNSQGRNELGGFRVVVMGHDAMDWHCTGGLFHETKRNEADSNWVGANGFNRLVTELGLRERVLGWPDWRVNVDADGNGTGGTT